MFGGAVNHCRAHFFGRSGNQLDGIPAFEIVGEVELHQFLAFVEAQNRAFVQTVRLAFVDGDGLKLASNTSAFKHGNDFSLNQAGRFVRHHVEAVGVFRHFHQVVALLYFGNGGFDHQRLYRSGAQRGNQRMGAGMVFVVFRPFSSLFRALFEDRVGIVEGEHDAAECDFLTEEVTRIRIGDVLSIR